ncbi:hypothetical protein MYCTH_2308420 [Thermothelomyces thermophilus ATCC 42464]|uniref:Extracellular membrane protein CFEM domain-containing protein n=1 Tax=Thermothelomyces thermophilus (strain ATCC 42464 / BCRC 31852 / DSM 1799) TaxID=573729 RepID=G2QJT5_THET4|nr:uncharacterized protein MYCTH_2308420 [Thermothelomyces thermophilus ATCC 42464]AEO59841.1 hypothetical protein MYCTH_2308420 [Thermothelomyces thermophilus ATCC 42464]
MKVLCLLLTLPAGILWGALAQEQCPGSWYLQGDDCICIRSTDGFLLKAQTLQCCMALGYKTYDNMRTSSPDHRSDSLTWVFSDLCRGPQQTTDFQRLLQRPQTGKRHRSLPLSRGVTG